MLNPPKTGTLNPRWLLLAVLLVALAALVRWLLAPLSGGAGGLMIFLIAVIVAAWYGGSALGMLATLLGGVASVLLFTGAETLMTLDFTASHVRLVLYFAVGSCISVLSGRLLDANRQMALSEERFRLMSETAPLLLWSCLPDGRLDYLNGRWVEYTGVPEADQLGYGWIERLHPDDRERTMTAWKSAVERSALFDINFRIQGRNGAYRWFKSRAVPKRGEAGKIVKWFGSNTDIDDLIRAEEALRESEERFRRLVESDVVGIVIADSERIVEANNYFLQIVGCTRDELESGVIDWRHITPPEYAEADDRALRQLLETGSCSPFEKEYYRKNGTRIPILIAGVRLDTGPSPRFLCFVLDTTERKRLEQQFRQAQKLETVGTLAGGIAHDFNNLLTVITGYAHIVLGSLNQQDPMYGPVQEISKAANRAASLTRQLLTFSRRQTSRARNINLNEIVQDMEKMLRRLISEDIELTFAINAQAGVIKGDPGQIEQVIVNLAVNARDAMPDGGRLLIETTDFFVDEQFAQAHLSVHPGPHVMLIISDTGTGMTPEVKEHIFEPFFTTKEQGKGTGLGLATVYGIVKDSGGTIWVYTELGKGTVFKMLFPAEEPPPDTPQTPVIHSGKETILLAEDEPGVRSYVRQVLEHNGYTVLETSNGREALERARQHADVIHLLLTDEVMPEMGGSDLAEHFASIRPGVPVLRMSGYTDRIWKHAETPGYIQKPFTPASLLAQIRSLLDLKTGTG